MARAKKQVGLEGIETGPLTLPKMDRISMTFALMLDSFKVESDGIQLWMACDYCAERVCAIEDGDPLRVLLNTALAHSC